MKFRLCYIVFFVMLLHTQLLWGALNAPDLRCLDIKGNGDVELTWVIPGDPGAVFDEYEIFYSTSLTGPYVQIANINIYVTNTYLHVGANAQIQQGFYYMVTRSDAPIFQYSPESDTLSTMMLSVANPFNGTAPMNWNPLHNPDLPTSGNYSVYYEYPAGVWNLSGTSMVTFFTDTIDICSSFINFRIEQTDAMGCKSVSSVDGDNYQNLIPPEIPILDSVSVDQLTQNAILGWQPSGSGDTEGYIIYQFIAGVWTPIDTVWGISSTSYENLLSNADTGPESYCIAAIDSCGITSPLTGGHTSMHLLATTDICGRSVELGWTHYTGFPAGVTQYNIFVSENGNPFSLLASVSGTVSQYTANGLNDGSTYCYYISAVSAGGLYSSSEFACISANFPDLPSYVYIRIASVESDGSVFVHWIVDPAVYVKAFSLQHSLSASGPFLSIDYHTYSGLSDYYFTDLTANADEQPVYYRIVVIDSCNNEAMSSDTVKTIHLRGKAVSDLTNDLFWNDYKGWPTGIQELRLYRSVDGIPDLAPVAVFGPGVEYFNDDVASFFLSNGLFTYRLEAIEAIGNPFGFTDTVSSNYCSIQQIPRLFIANAFAPDGYNKTFCPMGVYIDHTSYSFIIFNKLGEEMFNTDDFNECWDGTNDGSPAPLGVYHYVLSLELPGGQTFLKRGHITLIR
ncbi:MAG: hypothetical protein CVU11_07795 [Bacteroidetes bacterium HGW-Bacteroidetes-6]|jgi:hypothetical protein|nr:MAG: hypothetical protein CVU11_07795 [Bacteroidetes bacterium HGW-Bacteroidetes-6]